MSGSCEAGVSGKTMRVALTILGFWGLTAQISAAAIDAPSRPLRGILVVSTPWSLRNGDFIRSLSVPGVDGALVELAWSKLEPQPGVYDWAPLDTLLAPLAKSGQQAQVSIWTGSGTPDWLFKPAPQGAGARRLAFKYAAHRGGGVERDIVMAPPWDRAYLAAFDEFLAQLSSHLKKADEDRLVPMIRLTGINATTDELRLPAETAGTTGLADMTDSTKIWADAGFRPAIVRGAWETLVGSFERHFPEKSFGLALIPNGAFPAIDDKGNPAPRPLINRKRSADLNAALSGLDEHTTALTLRATPNRPDPRSGTRHLFRSWRCKRAIHRG